MSLSLSQVRSAVQSQIENISGMKVSPHPPDYFGRTQNTIAHKAFTVSIGTVAASEDRQRRSVGVYCNTSITVLFSYRMRPMDVYPTDYDNMLNLEKDVLLKCLDSYSSIEGKVQIRFIQSSRLSTQSNEYTIVTLEFIVYHTIGD